MREIHSAAGGIDNQQQQLHIRSHPQLPIGLMLMGPWTEERSNSCTYSNITNPTCHLQRCPFHAML
ncbi:hypothetical protein LDENG_00146250 [Lucifuga dentata]|nr:hypothetical protein LDENG_00146250 [Lucifuga dentata]